MTKQTPADEYNLRFLVLPRVLAAQAVNGEKVESWPDPPATSQYYFAAREGMSGAEQIVQGLRMTTGALKVRIKGRTAAVLATGRMKNVATGEVFNVVGVYRDFAETVVNLERVTQQSTSQ